MKAEAPRRLIRRDRLILLGLAVAAVVGLFLPFVGVPWEYDDKVEIVLNRVIRHPGDVGEMVRYNPFRVLLLYTFAWDLWAWGIDHPEGFRAANVALHALNAGLLLALLDRLGGRCGHTPATHRIFVASGTLLFAVHPLAIESVTYVSGRSSSLATTFVLLSLWAWVRHLDEAESPQVQAWLDRGFRRANLALGALLAAGLLAGLPAAFLVASERAEAARAVPIAVAVAGALLVLAAALGARRWRAVGGDVPTGVDRDAARRAARFYALAWIAFVLGCATKEIAATLPGLLFLLEGTIARRSWTAAFRALGGRLFPFFAIPLFLIVLRAAAYGYVASPVFVRPWTVNLLTQAEVVGHYAWLWVVPFPQSIFHDHPEVPVPGTAVTWLLAIAWIAVVAWAVSRRKSAPALAFGLLVIAATLAPTSSIFALKETMVEHRTYLPSVGYAFVVAAAFAALARLLKPRIAAGLLVVALAAYGTLHVSYDLLWRSEEVLWSHAVRVNPDASDAWRNLGDLFASEGRFGDAEHAYGEAVRSRPDNHEALSNLGLVLGRAGRLEEAETLLSRAVAVRPCYTPALNNLAMLATRRNDHAGAVERYADTLGCDPDNTNAHLGLGHLYYGPLRDRERAAQHYGRFVELVDPHHREVARAKQRIMELTW